MGVELTAGDLILYAVKMCGDGGDTPWVANEDYLVGKVVGCQMEVETAAVTVYYQF